MASTPKVNRPTPTMPMATTPMTQLPMAMMPLAVLSMDSFPFRTKPNRIDTRGRPKIRVLLS